MLFPSLFWPVVGTSWIHIAHYCELGPDAIVPTEMYSENFELISWIDSKQQQPMHHQGEHNPTKSSHQE